MPMTAPRSLVPLLVFFSLGLAIAARADTILPVAEQIIVQADAQGKKQSFDQAITLLRGALERYPTYTRLYESLAFWQEVRGVFTLPRCPDEISAAGTGLTPEGAFNLRKAFFRRNLGLYTDIARDVFDTFARGLMYAEDPDEIRARIAEITAGDYPGELTEYGAAALPGAAAPFTFQVSDAWLPASERGLRRGMFTTQSLPMPAQLAAGPPGAGLPADLGKFTHLALAYEGDPDTGRWRLRFRVFWQDTLGNDDRATLAQYSAELLLRTSRLLSAYAPSFSSAFERDNAAKSRGNVINVWLAEGGQAGGETRDNDIILYQVGVQRTPSEWVRELCHEYGHVMLKPSVEFVQPETLANGRLGERLFLRWLLCNPDNQEDLDSWIGSLDPKEEKSKRLDPVIAQFANDGPLSAKNLKTDEPAMMNYVGMALYLEMVRGSGQLASAIRGTQSPTFAGVNGFIKSEERSEAYHQSDVQPVVSLRLEELPDGIPLWIYLRDGTWKGELAAEQKDADLKLSVTMDETDKTLAKRAWWTPPACSPSPTSRAGGTPFA